MVKLAGGSTLSELCSTNTSPLLASSKIYELAANDGGLGIILGGVELAKANPDARQNKTEANKRMINWYIYENGGGIVACYGRLLRQVKAESALRVISVGAMCSESHPPESVKEDRSLLYARFCCFADAEKCKQAHSLDWLDSFSFLMPSLLPETRQLADADIHRLSEGERLAQCLL